MLAQLALAACFMAVSWMKDQEMPNLQVFTDLDGDGIDFALWEDDVKEDDESHQTLSPASADSFLPSSYEIVEVKRLSPAVTWRFDQLHYSITIKGRPLTMSLDKQLFLARDFQVFVDGNVDKWLLKFILSMDDCYYSGQILESTESSVTLRTCLGLRGILELGNESFIIEPLPTSAFLHMIYKMEASDEVHTIISESDTDLSNHSYQRQLLEPLKGLNENTAFLFSMRRYVKVSLFVTVEAYKILGASPKPVITTLLQVFSYVNTKFLSLKMEIYLSTVSLWTESNQCVIADNITDTLENFIDWLSGLSSDKSFNIALLIIDGQDSEVGKTYYGQMCSNNNGAVVTFSTGLSLVTFSSRISHILGHNLGILHHDSTECTCPASPCIMDVNMMMAANSKSFSSCSLEEFQYFIMKTGAACLMIHPNMKPLGNPSLCGNKVLDEWEACDCGTEEECRRDPCCDHKTCTLKPGAICASGSCCSKCEFLPYGTLCRNKSDECDLHEYCSGKTAVCPEDVFQQNGNPCNDEKSVCYYGKCQNVDLQCVQFFGPASRNADLECYKELNVKGDSFGNCGGVKGFYGSCHPQDVLCGKLHCTLNEGEAKVRPDMVISYYNSTQHICLSGDFFTDYFIDPLWIRDGTKCNQNKICINKKCTILSRSDLSCKRETTCNGNGVCNNKHECHCDVGWHPPFCNQSDDFGEIDVRKITDDTDEIDEDSSNCSSKEEIYLRNWLLVAFLLILPLIALLILFGKRKLMKSFPNRTDEESSLSSSEVKTNTVEMTAEVDK
ncbi:disintegrin and metalloproteinase domain-containing protein 9-like isoform X2 [Ranitomeya variabilis]|uniref:disintegrin and metalloproteinase domain-containing protein 9-like isoform X2 n=1 Tax=Ranitomeya variabilis TaxID=490064 RepID=UPI0040567B09